MHISILLFSTLLSWAAYDLNLFRRRGAVVSAAIEISYGESETLRQKKVHRHRLDVIPPWQRGRKKVFVSRCNYFSTKPRDVRFSDQRKIRRMFNNA